MKGCAVNTLGKVWQIIIWVHLRKIWSFANADVDADEINMEKCGPLQLIFCVQMGGE